MTIYWCECGAEPEMKSANKVIFCPCCGGYKTLHKYRKGK